jgi:hypothetical protein
VDFAKESFDSLMEKKSLVRKGWGKCGLLRAWEPSFQKEALRMGADGLLFKDDDPALARSEHEPFELDPEVGVPEEVVFEQDTNDVLESVMGECLQEDLPLDLWPTQGGAGPLAQK